LRQHCRYHHKRRNHHFGSKAHREPPDVDGKQPNIHTPSAALAFGPTLKLQRKLEDTVREFARSKKADAGDGDAHPGFSSIFDIANRRSRRRSQLGRNVELSHCCQVRVR